MSEKVLKIIKDKNIVIPLYIYRLRDSFKIELKELIFLMYLYNLDKQIVFDINSFANDLGYSTKELMESLDKLIEAKLLELKVVKNDKGIIEEFIDLEFFYEKINLQIINEEPETKTDIFQIIEKEFARTLSPIEVEIIKSWLEKNISEELILLALKEAVFNGVSNLKYIDKILYEWNKKNFKTASDVERHFKERRKKSSKTVDVYDYDWLDDEE